MAPSWRRGPLVPPRPHPALVQGDGAAALSGGVPGRRYPRHAGGRPLARSLGASDSGEITRRPVPPARTLRARSWLRDWRPRWLRQRRLQVVPKIVAVARGRVNRARFMAGPPGRSTAGMPARRPRSGWSGAATRPARPPRPAPPRVRRASIRAPRGAPRCRR